MSANVVHDWLWQCTPYPWGLPSDKQLADGTLAFGDLRAHVAREMAAAQEVSP